MDAVTGFFAQQSPVVLWGLGSLASGHDVSYATVLAGVLTATGVALAPGIDFDPVDGHRFMRLSFCGTPEEISDGIDRLVRYVG